MTTPTEILVAGDWHGNANWAENVIHTARTLPPPRIILQLGDFGFWNDEGGDQYLRRVQAALELAGAKLLITPGNHEDYDLISMWDSGGGNPFSPAVGSSYRRLDRIEILPRGYRWTWHNRVWLACGGAASPDRQHRQNWEARDGIQRWWEDEYITAGDVQRCTDGGHADVLACHDRPTRAYIQLPPWPRFWAVADLARCEASRHRLQRICDGTQPSQVMHGHYHQPFTSQVHDLGYGPCTVSQLNMDGCDDNYKVLSIATMEWVT
jgi:hypothetical protein